MSSADGTVSPLAHRAIVSLLRLGLMTSATP